VCWKTRAFELINTDDKRRTNWRKLSRRRSFQTLSLTTLKLSKAKYLLNKNPKVTRTTKIRTTTRKLTKFFRINQNYLELSKQRTIKNMKTNMLTKLFQNLESIQNNSKTKLKNFNWNLIYFSFFQHILIAELLINLKNCFNNI
jgi:hypothetical protein